MLILSHLIVFYYIITISFCNDEKPTEKEVYSSQPRTYKPEYSSGGIGSYSRGGLYAQSAVTAHHSHEAVTTEGCNMDEVMCLSMASQDRLGLDAIKSLHRQLDDDADGNVDFSESDEFLREDLKYEDGYQRRQQAFHRNDDKHISVRELWDAWLRSEVHNWTVEQTTEWLAMNVELPQYIPTFMEHRVTGATLPRLAVSNSQYLSVVLGIKDPIHKQKIALKAMDVVLFGPPKDFYHPTKDIILITLLLGALFGCWYAYRQNKSSRRHLRRMMKDMESLHKAELALEDLQRELEHAKKEQESVATEKLNLERRLLEQTDGEGMRVSYSDLEVNQLKAEVEMLRNELQRAEGELQDRCWSPPVGLQQWLQLTHEIENKAYCKKRQAAEKQLQQAREACEKLRKKRSSLVGAFVSTHGKSIDDVDRSIVEARTALNEVTSELQERVHRWKQIELLCGLNIINNNGLQYLETVLYRGTPNGRGLRGRMSSSQDDLDDDSGSIYSPSAGALEGWKEDSSGSEQGKNELDDEFQQETRSLTSNVHFTVGGDGWADEAAPLPVVPKRQHKSSMVRSYSQDTNVSSLMLDRERDRDAVLSVAGKLSQSESNLESPSSPPPPPRPAHLKKLTRDQSLPEADELRFYHRPGSDDGRYRRAAKDGLGEELVFRRPAESKAARDPGADEDTMQAFLKSVRDWELPDDDRMASYRKSREAPDDYRKPGTREWREPMEEAKRTASDDYRKLVTREAPDDGRRAGPSSVQAEAEAVESRRVMAEECRKQLEEIRRTMGLEDATLRSNLTAEDKEETYSTDSNSAAADETDTKRKKRKLFGNFRKHKSKLS